MKAMIFAAGLGTRLRPLTNEIPKALIPLNGKPALEWLILKLMEAGIGQIIINVHHFADKVIDFIHQKRAFGIEIKFSDERKTLLDTGGGLLKAAWFFDDGQPFLVYNADVLSDINLREMTTFHHQKKALVTLFIQKRKTSRYLIFDEEKRLSGWKNIKTNEKITSRPASKKQEDFAFNGIHIIDPAIFNLISEVGKFPIIETYLRLADKFPIIGFEAQDAAWMDIGSIENLPQANILAKQIYRF